MAAAFIKKKQEQLRIVDINAVEINNRWLHVLKNSYIFFDFLVIDCAYRTRKLSHNSSGQSMNQFAKNGSQIRKSVIPYCSKSILFAA